MTDVCKHKDIIEVSAKHSDRWSARHAQGNWSIFGYNTLPVFGGSASGSDTTDFRVCIDCGMMMISEAELQALREFSRVLTATVDIKNKIEMILENAAGMLHEAEEDFLKDLLALANGEYVDYHFDSVELVQLEQLFTEWCR